jgi:hypothetical protein
LESSVHQSLAIIKRSSKPSDPHRKRTGYDQGQGGNQHSFLNDFGCGFDIAYGVVGMNDNFTVNFVPVHVSILARHKSGHMAFYIECWGDCGPNSNCQYCGTERRKEVCSCGHLVNEHENLGRRMPACWKCGCKKFEKFAVRVEENIGEDSGPGYLFRNFFLEKFFDFVGRIPAPGTFFRNISLAEPGRGCITLVDGNPFPKNTVSRPGSAPQSC